MNVFLLLSLYICLVYTNIMCDSGKLSLFSDAVFPLLGFSFLCCER
jgi:hypothetical protein